MPCSSMTPNPQLLRTPARHKKSKPGADGAVLQIRSQTDTAITIQVMDAPYHLQKSRHLFVPTVSLLSLAALQPIGQLGPRRQY
jgi:hypothetical protein